MVMCTDSLPCFHKDIQKAGKPPNFNFTGDPREYVICVLKVLFISHHLGIQTLLSWVNINTQKQESEEAVPEEFMA